MKPVSLTLTGFRGIRDGLGRDVLELDFQKLAGDAQLIAIIGKNGRGKTTVIENLQPYTVLPSRAGADGLGSFSYYDHVFLPESSKDLVWEHEGKRYRTQMIFRVNGRKKTDAFLYVQGADGWQPASLPDGTLSDGKVDTYVRCVEGILGSAETFFTSAFSAQGRRQLSAYKNAEIKTLLADLLGLEAIRALGAQAAETARLLKAGLHSTRQECRNLQSEQDQTKREIDALGDTQQRIAAAQARKVACQQTVDGAKNALAKVLATKEITMQTEARRSQLNADRRAIIDGGKASLAALDQQDGREAERLAQLDRRVAQRIAEITRRGKALTEQRAKLAQMVESGRHIGRAERRLPLADRLAAVREARMHALRLDAERSGKLSADEKLVRERIAGIEREAGQAALKAQELARRFGLTAQVPCAGTDLQGQCKLLGDAREAKSLMPSADAQIGRLEAERRKLADQLATFRTEAMDLAGVHDKLRLAERKLRSARVRASAVALLAARRGELAQASEALASVAAQLHALPVNESGDTSEEQAERVAIANGRNQIALQRVTESKRHREALDRIDLALAALPPQFDIGHVTQAQQAVDHAVRVIAETESVYMMAVRDQQRADDANLRRSSIAHRLNVADARAADIEKELGAWNLFAKCMSNDGLIALSIDDAGPTLAGLANDLLLACYGPRFTVSIKTQVATAKGEAREGFDIVVHDGESGDSKSVTLMSGGEKVIINEILTRAVALYLAHNSGRRYQTLFSDEADGPLDAERKRMFMAMKREVLRLGGYDQEFFVSQTPELTAMADAVIDLEAMVAQSNLDQVEA